MLLGVYDDIKIQKIGCKMRTVKVMFVKKEINENKEDVVTISIHVCVLLFNYL